MLRDLKIQRQKDFLSKQLGSVSEVEAELKKNIDALGLNVVGIQPGKFSKIIGEGSMSEGDNDPEKTDAIAKYRYFLEPLGVNVESFSLSFDSGTFSFADAFEPISFSLESAVYEEILQELKLSKFRGTDDERKNVCGTLGKASSNAMNSSALKIKAQKYYDATCKPIKKNLQEFKLFSRMT